MAKHTNFKDQDYDTLKEDCVKNGVLFEDAEFSADNGSLFYSKEAPFEVVWKRPSEIHEDAAFFVDGASTADVSQGSLGNCWFVAAAASLSQEKEVLAKVIPDHESIKIEPEISDDYQGIFRFRFWRFGEWVEVVIDDRLPTHEDKLIFTRSVTRHEFWSALLEKAYAKLAGSYEALEGGNTADALVDFTGGVSERVDMARKDYVNNLDLKKELHNRMKKLLLKQAMCSASITVTNPEEMEQVLDNGLVKGHAYSITAVKTVPVVEESFFQKIFFEKKSEEEVKKLYLVKLRNPWGQKEWNGPWSDASEEWEQVSEEGREKLDIRVEDDGEFWMCWEDFCTHFTNVTICVLVNTSCFSFDKTYNEGKMTGKWSGKYAGGCINNKKTFLNNPQYMFDMTGSGKDEAWISLMQPDTRDKKSSGGKNLTIGFYVMKVEANRVHRARYIYPKAGDSTFVNSREVFERLDLDPGRYIIVPSTFAAKENGEFLLRVYTDEANKLEELLTDKPSAKRRASCIPIWKESATQLTVIVTEVRGLIKKEDAAEDSTVDPYCTIECEGTKITTPTLKDNLNPRYDYGGIFYLKCAKTATLKIQVWDSQTDTFLGGIATDVRINNKLQAFSDVQLYTEITHDGEGNVKAEGTVSFQMGASNKVGFM